MNDKKHTPGPWEVRADPSHYDSFTTVVAGSGEQHKGMLRELIVEVGGRADIEVAEANARDVAAKNGATSKKTGSDRGNDETREERAGNDVNERAAQCG